jgi:hypothetical protein
LPQQQPVLSASAGPIAEPVNAEPPIAEPGAIRVYRVSSILGDSLPRRQSVVDFEQLSL